MAAIGDQELEGTSGVSGDGFEFVLNIKSWTTPDPVDSVFGFEYEMTYKHAGFPDFFVRQMQGTTDPVAAKLLAIPVESPTWDQGLGPFWFSTDYDPLINTDVTVAVMMDNWFWWPVSECIDLAPAPVSGFAAMNGVDAWIDAPSQLLINDSKIRMIFDFRLHSAAQQIVVGRSNQLAQFTSISQDRFTWRGNRVDFSPLLNQGQWYNCDYRLDWDIVDGLNRVSIDGGADITSSGSQIAQLIDQIGKQGGAAPTSHFDLKVMTIERGGASSPTTMIDMPLDVNACDDGPNSWDGTTFNMVLPSCPP